MIVAARPVECNGAASRVRGSFFACSGRAKLRGNRERAEAGGAVRIVRILSTGTCGEPVNAKPPARSFRSPASVKTYTFDEANSKTYLHVLFQR